MSWVAAALKFVDPRPDVDPLTGEVHEDPRREGASEADRAALEWALRLGGRWGYDVLAVTAAPAEAEGMLREALAVGADRALRVDLPRNAASEAVAAALADVTGDCAVVCCGDHSLDRGSGSVPAFLAQRLGAAQALGLVGLAAQEPGTLAAERRLDGGRRERLRVPSPCVVSVESGTARPRRASLHAALAARGAPVEVRGAPRDTQRAPAGRTAAYRPRPRVLPAPHPHLHPRERAQALAGALAERTPPRVVAVPPDEAADELLAFLRDQGYLA
ncbi:MAG: mycofactocin-associated electron transfer flavoprotein beta subunit [Streptosporangiaceae bacterium]